MRFKITDDFGENYVVEEINDDEMIEEEPIEDGIEEINPEEIRDDEPQLSSEEITKLKGLLAVADKLMALIPTEDSEEEEEEIDETVADEEVEEDIDETVADEEIEEEEEVIDTAPMKDSASSLEKQTKKAKDSLDHQVDIANTWNNYYANFNRNK